MKKAERQYKQLAWRIKRLNELIKGGKCISAAKVAKELEVAPKTIQRDLEFIRDQLGAPLIYDSQIKKWVYTEATYNVPDIQMTKSEYVAILLAKKLFQEYTAVPIQEYIESAFKKIVEHLSKEESSELLAISNPISFSFRTTDKLSKDIYAKILFAIERNSTIEISYFTQSRGVQTLRKVDPYFIHNWYLVAYDHSREKVLDFHIGRIRSITRTNRQFQVKDNFDKEAYLSQGFGMFKGQDNKYLIEVEFSAKIGRWIKEQKPLHLSQTIENLADGGVLLKLELGELEAIKRFVLQFGFHARVIKPIELKEIIKAELIKLASLYDLKLSNNIA